jgi:hypothetical protein
MRPVPPPKPSRGPRPPSAQEKADEAIRQLSDNLRAAVFAHNETTFFRYLRERQAKAALARLPKSVFEDSCSFVAGATPDRLGLLLDAGLPAHGIFSCALKHLRQLVGANPDERERRLAIADLALDAVIERSTYGSGMEDLFSPLAVQMAMGPCEALEAKTLAHAEILLRENAPRLLFSACQAFPGLPTMPAPSDPKPSLRLFDRLLGLMEEKGILRETARQAAVSCLASERRFRQREEEVGDALRPLGIAAPWLAIDRLAARGCFDAPLIAELLAAASRDGGATPAIRALAESSSLCAALARAPGVSGATNEIDEGSAAAPARGAPRL